MLIWYLWIRNKGSSQAKYDVIQHGVSVCVSVCVCGIRAGRHRVAWQDSDSEARSSHLLLRWRSHHAQYAGLCTLVQRDCSPAWEECKVNISPWSHDTHSVSFCICIHQTTWCNTDYNWWVLSTAYKMRITLGTVVTGGALSSEPGCWGTMILITDKMVPGCERYLGRSGILKSMWDLIGSQWICCRAIDGVLVMIWAAAFWTFDDISEEDRREENYRIWTGFGQDVIRTFTI